MKSISEILSSLNEAVSNNIECQPNTINYLTIDELKKYLVIVDKFIGSDSKWVIKWLINNNNYVQKLAKGIKDNALCYFVNKGKPQDPSLVELYNKILKICKSGRQLEIPVFQTPEQFNDIISKNKLPDYILLDLDSAEGRNAIAIKYEPLIKKMVFDWTGKSSLSKSDLESAAYMGLTNAINSYGKKGQFTNAEEEKIAGTTFLSYAAYMIRSQILEDIKNLSRVVRIPVSAQNREREEKGFNTMSNTVSGDKVVGHDSDGDKAKTLFDYIGGSSTDSTQSVDNDDIVKLWDEIFKELNKKFDPKVIKIWCMINGLKGYVDDEGKPIKQKEIAKQMNCAPSNITYYSVKVNSYIQNNSKLKALFTDIYELNADKES